jgi:hypothetical protein
MGKRAKHKGVCPYCGRNKNGTEEHVIPNTLFLPGDNDKVIIFICHQCNNSMAAGIRDLRNWVALHIGSSNHPDLEYHLRKIYDTNEATRAWLQRVLDEAPPVDFVTEDGIVVGSALQFDFNKERARLALANIVRGLYLVETGHALPPDTPASVIELDIRVAGDFVRGLLRHDHAMPQQKGNDVAGWVPFLKIEGSSPDSSAWILCFLGNVWFLGGTGEVAAPLEVYWQNMLQDEADMPMINGRYQAKAPKLSDGTVWTPGSWEVPE